LSREKELTITLHQQAGFVTIKCIVLFMWVTIYILLQESINV